MYTVETYTYENGSNMDMIEYKDVNINIIALDLLTNYGDWDYAAVFENDRVQCFINREGKGADINWV